MKKKISTLLIAVSLLLALSIAPAHAYSKERVKADIPFEFTVAGKSFPAGEYIVEQFASRILMIRSTDGRYVTMFLISPVQPGASVTKAKLVFHRDGEQHSLFRVFTGASGLGFETPRTDSEEKLAKNSSAYEYVTVTGK